MSVSPLGTSTIRLFVAIAMLGACVLCLGCARASRHMVREAVSGVLDVGDWEPHRDGALPLQGEWVAAWGVQPDGLGALDASAPRTMFRMPDRVESQAPAGSWVHGQGLVSFVLELRGLPTDESLAIHVPTLWSSALRCRSSSGAETVLASSLTADVRVVSSLAPYALVLPRAANLTCTLSYAVPPPVEGWRSFFSEAPSLTTAQAALDRVSDHRAFYVALCAFMVTLASYMFVQWQARRREKAPLFVAVMFVVIAVWLAGYGAVFEGLAWPGFLLRRRIEYAAVSAVGASALWSTVRMLERPRTWLAKALAGLALGASLVTLLLPTRLVAWALFALAQPTTTICLVLSMGYAAKAFIAPSSSRQVRILALGIVLPAALGMVDVVLSRVADVRLGLISYGLVLLGFTIALTFARANAAAHRAAEVFADRSACFVPQEFLNTLGHADLTTVRLGDARERPMTVLFADLRNFTAMSEHLTPAETFAFLNDCFSRVGPPVREHGGFVDKYIGDAIMALFPADPAQAVRAALAMQKAIADVRAPRGTDRRPALGIGIHMGGVMMGTIGEERRFEATVISDAVNLAARLEGLTKQLGCGLVVSGAIAHELPDDLVPHIRELGRFAVKGKSEPVTVVEVFALDSVEVRRHKYDTKVRFRRGVDAFMRGGYEEATDAFGAIVDTCPEDGPAHWWFVRSIREFAGDGPESTRGFLQLDEK